MKLLFVQDTIEVAMIRIMSFNESFILFLLPLKKIMHSTPILFLSINTILYKKISAANPNPHITATLIKKSSISLYCWHTIQQDTTEQWHSISGVNPIMEINPVAVPFTTTTSSLLQVKHNILL